MKLKTVVHIFLHFLKCDLYSNIYQSCGHRIYVVLCHLQGPAVTVLPPPLYYNECHIIVLLSHNVPCLAAPKSF